MDKNKINHIEFITKIKDMQFKNRHDIWINGIRLFWEETKISAYAPYETDREAEGFNICFYSKGVIIAEIQNLDCHSNILIYENEVTGCVMIVKIIDTFDYGDFSIEDLDEKPTCDTCGEEMTIEEHRKNNGICQECANDRAE